MKYAHLAARVFDTPLAIDPRKMAIILHAIGPRFDVNAPAAEPLTAVRYERKPYAVTDQGVAVIDVSGTLVNRAAGMDAVSGMTSYEELGNEVLDAATDPKIKAILLRIDSPGGEVNGLFDLADLIEQAGGLKPTWAAVDGDALSAGYLLAASAERVWITQTAGAGSIGVIAVHIDESRAEKNAGLDVTMIYAGKHKADANPHEPLSDSARAAIQDRVNGLYDRFVAAVASRRSLSPGAVRDTEAGLFFGAEAIKAGLADKIGTFRDALAAISGSADGPLMRAVSGLPNHGVAAAAQAEEVSMSVEIAPAEETAPVAEPKATVSVAEVRSDALEFAAQVFELASVAGVSPVDILRRNPVSMDQARSMIQEERVKASGEEIQSHVMAKVKTEADLSNNPVVKAALEIAASMTARKEK